MQFYVLIELGESQGDDSIEYDEVVYQGADRFSKRIQDGFVVE
jgi:hypothetical protein